MKSLGLSNRLSVPKVLIALLSLILIFFVESCTNQQPERAQVELPSDESITETVQSQFEATDEVPAENIVIQTENGVVTLEGNTTNLLAKKRATEIAQSTFGVLSVVNNLKITSSRPDEAIDEDLDRALATDPATEYWDITTEVENGTVTLTGRADSWQERNLAGTIASRVKGVKQINNNIIVNYSGNRTDNEIEAEIEQAIKMNSQIAGDMVEVNVSDGTVSLSGAIGSAREKALLQDLARVTGVEAVEADRLEVHPEYDSKMFRNNTIDRLTADQMRDAIIRALRYDPRVPQDSITVTIDGDIAVLEGTVQNLNSKLAAGEDARHTAGISSVQNNITVEHKVVVTPDVATTDEAIEERIRYALLRDPYVEEIPEISIQVNNGIAEITGTVDTEFEKQQVRGVTENIKGVIAIDNQLKLNDSNMN